MRPFEPYFVQKNGLFAIPVCHYRMEFALYVKSAFDEIKPDCVAVELPSTLDWHIKKAVERFPYISLIFYQNGKGDYIYFPIEPSDPLCEGVRSGLENNIPVHCIDLDMDDYPLIFDPMPDSYAVKRIGLKTYHQLYEEVVDSGEKDRIITPHDKRRESAMAYHLQKLMSSHKKVLFICGMTHLKGVMEEITQPQARPLGKVLRKDLRIFNPDPDSIREITGEIPFVMSLYEMSRGKHQVEKEIADTAMGSSGATEESLDTPVSEGPKVISLAERRQAREEKKTGVVKNENEYDTPANTFEWEAVGFSKDSSSLQKQSQEQSIFQNFMKKLFGKLLQKTEIQTEWKPFDPIEEKRHFDEWMLKIKDNPYIKREKAHKFRTSGDRRNELLRFYRNIIQSYPDYDRQTYLLELLKQSAKYYYENVNDEIKQWQIRVYMKYARNWARITGSLIPDLYQMIVCARGCADDNFAYEVWDLATYYPWQDKSGKYQTIHIRADEVWLNGKKIFLRRKFPYLRKRWMRVPVKDRKNEKRPGEWAEKFDGSCICSYPPEDIVIENYGNYLSKKGVNLLNEENCRVVAFTSSLLDGIDVRETLRNWHEKKLYVREEVKVQGGVGSVVVIFDEDIEDKKFSWKLTWMGEHHQESDMAFYSTYPADKVVGPGISRCEYGGFMMTYPPQRVWDVWSDPVYSQAKSNSEVLLMSAIEYSVEKNVVYVAAKPPRSYYKTFASRLGKRLIYVPIGQLSPVSIKKIRVFHVLSSNKIREIAKDYIW
ncbi:MAG: hypothetical protein K8T10_02235 [Candidatus Eremiobacteraeota bacterium]|nr:hypothetical protein [Candidatus Eremiobacteraeota bacterium]